MLLEWSRGRLTQAATITNPDPTLLITKEFQVDTERSLGRP